MVVVERNNDKTTRGATYLEVALNFTLTCLFQNHFSGEPHCALNHTSTAVDFNYPRLALAQEHTRA